MVPVFAMVHLLTSSSDRAPPTIPQFRAAAAEDC